MIACISSVVCAMTIASGLTCSGFIMFRALHLKILLIDKCCKYIKAAARLIRLGGGVLGTL